MNNGTVLLANVGLSDGSAADIRMADGIIEEVGPGLDAAGAQRFDGGGLLVLPGMIDGHVHLDKTLTGLPWMPHPAGPDRESRIATERGLRATLPPPAERASNLVRQAIALGATAFRSHADIGPDIGVRHVEALLEVKAAFAHAADFQIVAFPQYGVLAAPGTCELMDEALAMGADLVGGIDPIDRDGDLGGQLDLLFGLAGKHDVGIDIHIHDPGEAGLLEIAALAERTRAAGMEGRVTVSHGFCLGACPEGVFEHLAGAMAEAGMSLASHGGGASPLPPVKKLRERGVELFVGNDDVRDTWGPYGNGDLLIRAMLLSWRSGFRADGDLAIAFDCATAAPRRVFGQDDRGIAAGAPADLFTVHAERLAEAVAQHPQRGLVFKGGRLVARDGAYLG
ncbi:MAG: amidohydrolase [Alphaproteobacteria bacterium]|nr:amidohydrolase [Alphaproteobacteria bacterium]